MVLLSRRCFEARRFVDPATPYYLYLLIFLLPSFSSSSSSSLPPQPPSCLPSFSSCHPRARCVDFPPSGVDAVADATVSDSAADAEAAVTSSANRSPPTACCVCDVGLYGNGAACFERDAPRRVSGKVRGVVNGVDLGALDLHSYVVTREGRAYTALSLVPGSVGFQLQAATAFGGVIGWLFAAGSGAASDVSNGFSLTGGVLVHRAEAVFEGGAVFKMTQTFTGVDVYDQLGVAVELSGALPTHLAGAQRFTADDYREAWRRTAPGTLEATSRRSYRVDGAVHWVEWNETIEYDECEFLSRWNRFRGGAFEVGRHFVVFDEREGIVRFALTTRAKKLEKSDDPCVDVACGTDARCVIEVDGGVGVCRCNEGFEGDGETCRRKIPGCEELECEPITSRCVLDPASGRPACECRSGYARVAVSENDPDAVNETGVKINENDAANDGIGVDKNETDVVGLCVKIVSCSDLICGAGADCVEDAAGRGRCLCRPGFSGDGLVCRRVWRRCADLRCTADADCYDATDADAECRCREGFLGDGKSQCRRMTCEDLLCHADAECIVADSDVVPECRCRRGYGGDGFLCRRLTDDCSVTKDCHVDARCVYDPLSGRYACRCNRGFEGDGRRCIRAPNDGLSCDVARDCHAQAKCVVDDGTGMFVCRCDEGFVGDGYHCGRTSCRVDDRVCDRNARCVLDSIVEAFVCRCVVGFRGDGESCHPVAAETCLEVNDCHADANCIFDEAASTYSCQCAPGFVGDGVETCVAEIPDCLEDPGRCDANAECVLFNERRLCRCRPGFSGDGRICAASGGSVDGGKATPPTPAKPGFLVYAHGMSLMKIPDVPVDAADIDAGNEDVDAADSKAPTARRILIRPGMTAVGLSVDCYERRIFWSDVAGKSILSADYEGKDVVVVVDEGLGSPEGLAVDWLGRRIYWTDSTLDRIEVASLDGRNRKEIVDSGLVNPRAIAVDPVRGRMFWSDWNREGPKVETASLDGSSRRKFLFAELGLPNALSILDATNEVCVADADRQLVLCADMDDPTELRSISVEGAYPFGLVAFPDRVFWTDWRSQRVEGQTVVENQRLTGLQAPVLGGNGRIYGLAALAEQCPPGGNACTVDDGGCAEGSWCFARVDGNATCICPDDADCRGKHEE